MDRKQQLTTNASNLAFWKQVQEEISEFTCPIFLCTHSATFGENWDNYDNFRQEVGYLANKFLAEYNSIYEIAVNDLSEIDAQLFMVINTIDTPVSNLTFAKVRIDFVEWVINYLITNQPN